MSVKICLDCHGEGIVLNKPTSLEVCDTCAGTGYVADCVECKTKKALTDILTHCKGCNPKIVASPCANSALCKLMARAKEAMENSNESH
jgi:DnaJ-class molecular chaperone